MKSATIKAIIGGKEPYAYAFMTREHGYGHMNVRIRLAESEWSSRRPGSIMVSCQIGGDPDYKPHHEAPYAQRYGFDSENDQADLASLESAVKMMKKIGKYMDKCYEANGNSDCYAEFCHRVVRGSGAKSLITEPHDGWANGGVMADKDLFTVGGDSRDRLAEMEKNLIQAFSRKEA